MKIPVEEEQSALLHDPVRNRKKVSIAFDTWTLSSRFRNSGIYVYSREILLHLARIAAARGADIKPFVCRAAENDANDYRTLAGLAPAETAFLRSDRAWRYGGSWLASSFLGVDVVFQPTYAVARPGVPVPLVTTVHDLTPFVMPNFTSQQILRKLRFQLRWAVRQSRHFITDSETCRDDLIRLFKVPAARISVVYLGYNKAVFNAAPANPDTLSRIRDQHGLGSPYLFHHGLMQPRKNLKRLIQAYGVLLSRNPALQLDLVLAGRLDWKGEELVEAAKQIPESRGKVVFTGPLADDDMGNLLKGAALVVIPSLYEGFCLPLVEAMASGVPAVCSQTSCLPEVSGGVLRYFDPASLESMADCIEQVLASNELRQELSRNGLRRAAHFDWLRTAEQTLDVLLAVAGGQRQ